MNDMIRSCFKRRNIVAAFIVLVLGNAAAHADGIYRNGVGARAMGMGGADTASPADPLGSMALNPAGLGFLTAPELDFSVNGAFAYGNFSKSGSGGSLSSSPGAFPDVAFAMPLGKSGFTAGLSFITDSALNSDWHFNDPVSAPPAGTFAPVSYGNQTEKSEILVFRSAAGLGYTPAPEWSFGANVGLDYNQNQLKMPYVFQTTPGLVGAKTLLDLHTDGVGWNAEVGVLYKPLTNLQFGATYKSPTTIFSQGDATGDAGLQLGVSHYPFHYNAQVKNVLPEMVTVGGSWQFTDQWRAALQLDWINWAGAFTQLPVSLSSGNSGLPSALNDYIPLNWRDEFVYRAGVEYQATTNLVLRGGYCYGKSPVPSATLSPLTATITEHTLTTGAGWHWSRYSIDFAYQWDIPATRHVDATSLQAQEFSNSSVQVGIQTFVLTTGIRF